MWHRWYPCRFLKPELLDQVSACNAYGNQPANAGRSPGFVGAAAQFSTDATPPSILPWTGGDDANRSGRPLPKG
jgi:hypothetical protein